MEELLKVKGMQKKGILKDIDLTVEKGEMVAVMGPSGSGKSTLLYQVSGMDRASDGEILLGGTDLMKLGEKELSELRLNRIGFVFQQMNMLKNLNIRDNILLPAYHSGKSAQEKEQARQRAASLMNKLGVAELAERKINEVSGGQLQRACICRSMINEPEILFADEPTGALNRSASDEVMDELLKLNSDGMTILLVTHDSKVAGKCDRILYLLDGRLMGELKQGKWRQSHEKERELRVTEWLGKMGW